jgi:hypothetical protein
MPNLSVRLLVTACLVCGYVHAQQPIPTASPIQVRLAGHLEAPPGPTAVERAIKSVGEQIEAKHAADAVRLQLSSIWELGVWHYLPADPAHTLNSRVASDDDPFFTPEYLKVAARRVDYELRKSEKASRDLLK